MDKQQKHEISEEEMSCNNMKNYVSDKLLNNIETNQKEKGQYALLRLNLYKNLLNF